jgi:hypothetical protein
MIGLMAGDGDDRFGPRNSACGAHHVLDQRHASGAMQNFRVLGSHARAQARGQNHNASVGVIHRYS